jgi:hypothetical protein
MNLIELSGRWARNLSGEHFKPGLPNEVNGLSFLCPVEITENRERKCFPILDESRTVRISPRFETFRDDGGTAMRENLPAAPNGFGNFSPENGQNGHLDPLLRQ